jgi:hypothetical protein
MAGMLPNARRSTPGSFIDRFMSRLQQHPDSFDCGIRVLAGSVAGEGPRWQYRRSGADPLIVDHVVHLNHGTKVPLRLIVDTGADAPDDGVRAGHTSFCATDRDSGARLQVSVNAGELWRFGIKA